MSTETIALYSRLDPELTARSRMRLEKAKATRGQSVLEYTLFAVFGAAILIAAIALVVTNSASFRHVPNTIADGIRADRVNILVMQTYKNSSSDAIGTDALMLMSIKPSTRAVAVTSIPRDLWVKLGRYGQRRLGAAPSVGSSSGYPGEGPGLTADTIESVLGQPVHGYIRLDRRELAHGIDALGGVDVVAAQNVYEYAHHERFLRGHRYHMNAAETIRYAFSPYVVGPAADRFAREARQQEIIAALFAKASEPQVFPRVAAITFGDHTNLAAGDVAWLANTVDGHTPRCVTLKPFMDTFEVATFADTGEAVGPRNGDFRPVRQLVANVFSQTTAITAK